MARKRPVLDQMCANPRADWTMDDIRTMARQEGLDLAAPRRGSHHTLRSPHLRDIVTIPHNRPIKVIYIREAASYALAHRQHLQDRKDEPR